MQQIVLFVLCLNCMVVISMDYSPLVVILCNSPGIIVAYLYLIVHFILFYFSHHGNSQSFESLTSIKPQNAPWCGVPILKPQKFHLFTSGQWKSRLERWTGDRLVMVSNPAAATSLRNFGNSVYPGLPVSFGRDTKSRRFLLYLPLHLAVMARV